MLGTTVRTLRTPKTPRPTRRRVPRLAVETLEAREVPAVDQAFDPVALGGATLSTHVAANIPGSEAGQTFTVGMTGKLTQVDLYMFRFGAGTVGDLILDIRGTEADGKPTAGAGQELLTLTVPALSVPGGLGAGPTFVSFNLTAFNLQVTAGQKLAATIAAVPTTDPAATSYWIGGRTGDPYANPKGGYYSRTIGQGGWSFGSFPDGDMGFRTYVESTGAGAAPPVVTLPGGPAAYAEGDPPVRLDPGATVTDPDSSIFDRGTLTVSLAANGTADDRLAIRHEGTAFGQIGVSGNAVTYSGTIIGSWAGGVGSTPLAVNFNASATLEPVQALLRNLTFGNVSDTPALAPRTVQVVLTDGLGGTSAPVTKTVTVSATNDAPAVTTNAGLTVGEGGSAAIGAGLLAATDPDNAPAQLTYTVTAGPAHGTLLRDGAAVTTFTQADVNAGRISYVHDGFGLSADGFSFTVSDGTATTAAATFAVTVAPQPGPTVTINQAAGQPDPGGPGPVLFDVVFSEPVTGFDGADVSFDGSTVGGTPVAAVTGSGATYTVTVTGLVGSGTLVARIPGGRAIDASGDANQSSTSTDNSVTYEDPVGRLEFASAVFTGTEKDGFVTVTVTRTGGTGGDVSVDVSTADGTAHTGGSKATGQADYTPTSRTLTWDAGVGGSQSFTVPVDADGFNEGRETILLSLSNPTGGAAAGSAATAVILPSDPRGPGMFLDADKDMVTVKLKGPGTLGFYLTDPDGDSRGPLELIEVADTDPLKSSVTVAVKKGPLPADGKVALGGVTGSGLKAITATRSDLDAGGVNLAGPLGALSIGDVRTGAVIIAGGTATQKTKIKAGVIGDGTTIQLGTALANLTATQVGAADITAPSVGKILVKGNARAGVTGSFAADLTVGGRVGVLQAAGLAGNLTAGSVGVLNVRGDLTGDVTVTGAGVTASRPALTNLNVTGAILGSDISVAGNVAAVSAGAFRDSRLFAGYSGADNGSGDFNLPATINSFKVTGPTDAFHNSRVIASALRAAVLKSLDPTNEENGNEKFGFYTQQPIGSLRVLDPVHPFPYDPAGPSTQGIDDFEVKVV